MPQNGGGNGGSGNGGSGQSTVVKAAKAAKAKAAAKVAGARAAHLERIEQHAQWMAGGPRTQAEFEEHGKAAVQPALDYYTRRFNMVDGNMYDLKRAFRAAKVFDPFVLKGMARAQAELLIDDLSLFGFTEFTPAFISGLKSELPELMKHAQALFDWTSDIPGAAAYDATLKRKAARKAALKAKAVAKAAAKAAAEAASSSSAAAPPDEDDDEEDEDDDEDDDDDDEKFSLKPEVKKWEDDPTEKARRIWEWWRHRVKPPLPSFIFWATAVRLVALVQPSSAAVERLFSELKLILEQVGRGLTKTIQGRLMARYNTRAGL